MHSLVRSLMVLSAGATIVALTACGSGGTEPRTPAGPLRMSVVGGDEQSDTIQALLPTPIRVRAMRGDSATGLMPAAGQLVNFVVVEPDCGRPFAGSATTDAQGFAIERWELGPKAGTCHMEVRSVDQTTGHPVVHATATATVKPGAVDTLIIAARQIFFVGTRVPARSSSPGRPIVGATSSNAPHLQSKYRCRGQPRGRQSSPRRPRTARP